MKRPIQLGPGFSLQRLPARHTAAAAALLLFITLIVLVPRPSFGTADEPTTPTEVSLEAVDPLLPATPAIQGTPAPGSVERLELVTPTPSPEPEFVTHLAKEETVAANELGRVPILMYHAFVHNVEHTDEWTITFDQLREQLNWLRDNDFVAVGLNGMLDREFDIPAGKRPVILTFDDASAGQFGLQEAPGGGFEVKPDTAVGVLEEYRQAHPGFIQTAFFAVLPYNCFASEDDPSTCEERLTWLVEHDYEIGNHTMGHENLTNVSIERFKEEIVGPIHWINERISGKNNLSEVLVLPFGAYPASEDFVALLFDGFWVEGEYYLPKLVIEVGGGPTRAPYHVDWATNLSRYNTEPEMFWYWADQISSGELEIYVSDGNTETVTIPQGWEKILNEELVREDGRRVVILS
ncbi:MAG TPA: polysaccharide deacetylase family protein [Thermomicrobiales bacterium]|nr:polysaccharide deacetylase family protein [Thermomicrobiales bacterium]